MSTDYSFKVLETLLMLKKYKNRNDVINTGTMITKSIFQDDRFTADVKASYREAMKKLDTLSFDEMKEIIGILESYDDDESDVSANNREDMDIFDDGSFDYETGVNCYKNKEYEKAANSFQKAATLGNAKALHGYGLCLYYGLGTKADKVKAIKQFVAASNMGIKEADNMIDYIIKEHSINI